MTAANDESSPGALDGMRVLDMAAPLGALVSRMLGDLGADVINIEPPGGDPGRHLSPFLTTGQERFRTLAARPMWWSVPQGWPPGRPVASI